jgi:hypothetical protein
MAIELVNGYPCRNCSEAAKAQRGIDPRESAVEAATAPSAAQQANETLDPRAVTAPSEGADVRAPLDFTRFVDKLV